MVGIEREKGEEADEDLGHRTIINDKSIFTDRLIPFRIKVAPSKF